MIITSIPEIINGFSENTLHASMHVHCIAGWPDIYVTIQPNTARNSPILSDVTQNILM
jgi:hypothetical protein